MFAEKGPSKWVSFMFQFVCLDYFKGWGGGGYSNCVLSFAPWFVFNGKPKGDRKIKTTNRVLLL